MPSKGKQKSQGSTVYLADRNSIFLGKSTIEGAGNGLFVREGYRKGTIFYYLGTKVKKIPIRDASYTTTAYNHYNTKILFS